MSSITAETKDVVTALNIDLTDVEARGLARELEREVNWLHRPECTISFTLVGLPGYSDRCKFRFHIQATNEGFEETRKAKEESDESK